MPSVDLSLLKSPNSDAFTEPRPNSDSLPMSWYPVAKSNDLKKGRIKAIDLFKQQWIVYRNFSGKVCVVSRYCCHMGVDLVNGKVVADRLVCPMHLWEFNADGACVDSPVAESIPKSAKQATLPCCELYGVIFVFWGKEILFELPKYPGLIEPMTDKPHYQLAATPYLSIMLNAFDIHHLKHVHNREVVKDPLISSEHNAHLAIDLLVRVILKRWTDYITRLLGFKTANIRFDCWGGNLIMVSNHSAKFRVLLALAPASDTTCHVYFIGAMEQHHLTPLTRLLKRAQLYATSFLGKEFLKLDIPIFAGMQPKAGVLLKEADAAAVKFWQHWKRLPRREIISNKSSIT